MVVPLMQSISGGNDCTYMLYMSPLMAGMLGLPCRPCLGPWKLKFGDYREYSRFWGSWGWYVSISGSVPPFLMRIFEAEVCGNCLGVGTLKDGYIRKVPLPRVPVLLPGVPVLLPRVPRIQSASHMCHTHDTCYYEQVPHVFLRGVIKLDHLQVWVGVHSNPFPFC
jgi:hypothetical protein